jgi:hypothetical protein
LPSADQNGLQLSAARVTTADEGAVMRRVKI